MFTKPNKFQIYVFSFFVLFFSFSINSEKINILYVVLFLLGLICIEAKMVLRNMKFFFLFLIGSFISLITFLVRDFYINASLSLFLFSFFILVQIFIEKKISYKVYLTLIALYLLFVLYRVISGVDLDEIMQGRSKNMVSFYYIILTCLFYIEYFKEKKRVILFPAFFCLLFSLFLIGRSGILTSLLLFLFILGYKLYSDNKIKSLKLIGLTGVSLFFLLSFYGNYIFGLLEIGLSRFFELRIDGAGREDINNTYVSVMFNDISSFVFGVKLTDPIFANYKFNLHNSFLSAHYFFGVFSFFLIGTCVYAILKGRVFFYKLILIVLLFRGFFDQVFFIDFMDVVIVYLVLLLLGTGKKWKLV